MTVVISIERAPIALRYVALAGARGCKSADRIRLQDRSQQETKKGWRENRTVVFEGGEGRVAGSVGRSNKYRPVA